MIHSDVLGPVTPTTVGGSKYVLTFTDDCTRKSWVYFLRQKSEVFEKFKEFKALLKTQKGACIKKLRSDGGGEYISNKFQNYLKKHEIEIATTPPYSPQMNGVAERLNRTLLNKARCMIKGKKVHKKF